MRYIISGSRGLIGEKLKQRLDKNHKCVMEIDLRKGSNILNLDAVKLNPKTQDTSILFHTAAHCRINEGTENPELPHINNCDGTHKVLEFCRKNNIPKIMNFSSSRVLSEERNPYVASKIYGEELTKAYGECYGLEWITVRPSTVYGECNDITSRLITTWCQNAIEGKDLVIFGDKKKTLDFTYVTDFVDGIELLLNNWTIAKRDTYNISGEDEVNLTYLANFIKDEAKSKSKIIYKQKEIAQPQQVQVNISKMKILGFKPKVDIKEGIKRLVRFYKNG